MKKFLFLMLIAATMLAFGCKKYYFDGGLHQANYSGNMLQYLQSNPAMFDSTVRVINLAGMKDVIEKEQVTFFAPPSGSIFKTIKRLNQYLKFKGKDTVSKLEQIKPEVWRNTLAEYVFKGKNLLKDYPQRDTLSFVAFPGQSYTSYDGRIMNVGVIFNDVVVQNGEGSVVSRVAYAGYRQLYLAYIPDLSNPKVSLVNIPVATSDIQPTNGVLHVLNRNRHNFGFDTDEFIDRAISAGITPAP
ncbi:hypothetical protein EZJ43_09470 [Pedobacter changchengzhani]|uniref:FAS1 domain-containing protein n=1 Tax=Pedobacter changchengzhani TaxID=2529274 RepID=A0A4R5MKW4_9SPHI|nr:hypothetical protein [Pedobacter changchengzhani]TDG36222.1 hypothetical protein EZJ43_09470 [Pedobacter changchengzhani]